eukprot:811405_1
MAGSFTFLNKLDVPLKADGYNDQQIDTFKHICKNEFEEDEQELILDDLRDQSESGILDTLRTEHGWDDDTTADFCSKAYDALRAILSYVPPTKGLPGKMVIIWDINEHQKQSAKQFQEYVPSLKLDNDKDKKSRDLIVCKAVDIANSTPLLTPTNTPAQPMNDKQGNNPYLDPEITDDLNKFVSESHQMINNKDARSESEI